MSRMKCTEPVKICETGSETETTVRYLSSKSSKDLIEISIKKCKSAFLGFRCTIDLPPPSPSLHEIGTIFDHLQQQHLNKQRVVFVKDGLENVL